MTQPKPADLLTISAFAAASRLSLKALRLYDELGLLPPARVDEHNGYRLYSPAQLPDARLIALLRQLDLPLTEIHTLLNAPAADRPELLRQHWAQVRAEHSRRNELFRYLQGHLQGEPNMTDFNIQTRHVPAQPVASLTVRVLVPDLPRTIDAGLNELQRLMTAQGGSAAGAPFVIYHGEVNADSDGPIELCQPYAGTLTPAGNAVLRVEPAHDEAYVVLNKKQFEFPAILAAYDALDAYAKAHGAGCPLAPREVYPYDWDNAGPDDAVGEVAWPYAPV